MFTSERRVVLTRAQALVLSDWIERMRKAEVVALDQAEREVLGVIGAQLEEQLGELFDPQYASLLDAAKREILDESRSVDDDG